MSTGGAYSYGMIDGALKSGAGAYSGEPPPMGRRPVLSEGSQKPCVQRYLGNTMRGCENPYP